MKWIEGFKIAGIILGVIISFSGVVELIFRPFRKRRDQKKASKKREARIDESLEKIDAHLSETAENTKWHLEVDKRLALHDESIKNSKNERRVLWRAQRATLDGLAQLGVNGMVTGAIIEMDTYADDNIR